MEDRAPAVATSEDSSPSAFSRVNGHKQEGRGAWVLTCYGISGLALFGVLAYFISDFLAH